MKKRREREKEKRYLDFSGNQQQPLGPTQGGADEPQQQNLNTTYTHYHHQQQPPQYAEGIIISHQKQPPKEPTLCQRIDHTIRQTENRIRRTIMGMRSNNTGGEIVQVEGGHIVRSTGRKDRHSKVYTAKGPRDRRVRLSAHTAIEFYDVQDRLGYDRPSKAVDWLIKKAKPSIDKLAELPPWHPISAQEAQDDEEEKQNNNNDNDMANTNNIAEQSESSNGYNFHHSAFITAQQQIETDPIANFFPTTSTNLNSSINFQNYPHDIISARTNNNPTEDNILGLSLQSFQQAGGGGANQAPSSNEHHQSTLFADRTTNVGGFEGHHFQKIVAWNTQEAAPMEDNMNRVGGFMVNSQPFLGHQSGTLQSSSRSLFAPSLRSWSNINPMNSSNSSEHHRSQQQQIHQASTFGSRFLSDGLAGFCIPTRIQGEEENHGHGVASNNSPPSSASPNSHH